MNATSASHLIAQAGAPEDAPGVSINRISVNNDGFTVARVDLRKAKLHLFWERLNGSRFGTFDALSNTLRDQGQRLIFATNAGIFDPSFTPCGLHVEDGRELISLNLGRGEGNFYMKPNGVFLVDDSGGHVVESTKYARTTPDVQLATQSGPTLLIAGQINPGFDPHSVNRRVRSGVGVSSSEVVYFVLSSQPVTFHALASVFLDKLGCHDALYLDGVISRFYLSGEPVNATAGGFAGILAVTVSQTKSQPTNTTDQ